MRIKCLHGYFILKESVPGEMSELMSLISNFDIVAKDDYFTFSFLESAPKYSIKGNTYLGALATKTIEGQPWEVMRENGLVYNFVTDTVVNIQSVTQRVEVHTSQHYFLSPGLILPGSVTDDGNRVTDYAAWFLFASKKFKYTELRYE